MPTQTLAAIRQVTDKKNEVAKMIQAGKTLSQIEKEFKVPQEFAHYKRPERLKDFLKLFYHQLVETGY